MIDRANVLIFTPTYDNLLRHETVSSIVAQQTNHFVTWEIGRCNPYPGRDMRNVLAQYAYAREMCLRGPYDALLTVEHDMTLPMHAVQRLCDTPAPVVYGTYLLRHNDPVLSAWRYEGTSGLGMSLERYPAELQRFREAGVGRVSGCGFGCTLIRRQVLETIPFRPGGQAQAPDMPFALDCVRKEVLQLARFDVECGHIHKGDTLEIQGNGGSKVMVTCIQSVNVIDDGGGVSMIEGETYAVTPENAESLTALGYVKPAKEGVAKALKPGGIGDEPTIGGHDEPSIGDLGQGPKVPRR